MMNPMIKRKVPQSGAHCHIMIAKVAQGITREMFDNLMHHNDLYATWRSHFPEGTPTATLEDEFVKKNWGAQIPAARATLARMLTQPIPDGLKNEITEALILDATLMKGRVNPARVLS